MKIDYKRLNQKHWFYDADGNEIVCNENENKTEVIKRKYKDSEIFRYLNGADGYPEYSEEWQKCGTVCAFCTDHPTEKCGSCEWAMPVKGTINGVYVSYIECQNPEKVWNHNSSRRKKRTTPKCRFWQPKKKGGAKE